MWEAIAQALSALRDGSLSPITLGVIAFFGLMVWFSAKAGEKIIETIGNLLSEGKTLRATLNEELERANSRTDRMQGERDEAMRKLGQAQVDLAKCQTELHHANYRASQLAQDLMDAHIQLQDAKSRPPRAFGGSPAPT